MIKFSCNFSIMLLTFAVFYSVLIGATALTLLSSLLIKSLQKDYQNCPYWETTLFPESLYRHQLSNFNEQILLLKFSSCKGSQCDLQYRLHLTAKCILVYLFVRLLSARVLDSSSAASNLYVQQNFLEYFQVSFENYFSNKFFRFCNDFL